MGLLGMLYGLILRRGKVVTAVVGAGLSLGGVALCIAMAGMASQRISDSFEAARRQATPSAGPGAALTWSPSVDAVGRIALPGATGVWIALEDDAWGAMIDAENEVEILDDPERGVTGWVQMEFIGPDKAPQPSPVEVMGPDRGPRPSPVEPLTSQPAAEPTQAQAGARHGETGADP